MTAYFTKFILKAFLRIYQLVELNYVCLLDLLKASTDGLFSVPPASLRVFL